MHIRTAHALLLLALIGLPLGGCKRDDARPRKPAAGAPNIVLISVDTLRADHLGCYGYARPTSSRIDRLAQEGALFEYMISSTSWTLPAHCALFTGLADSVHGCTDTDRRLDDSRTTLAERLKEHGYATVGFFSGPSMRPEFGVAQGFDQYVDCTVYAELREQARQEGKTVDIPVVRGRAHRDVANPRTYAAVRQWLDAHDGQPFFAFIHLWDVHADYIPPPPYDTLFDPNYTGTLTGENFATNPAIHKDMPARDLQHLIALYDGEIAWTDAYVGRILDDLDRLGLRDNTIVALLADHGDEHFEHGRKGHRQTLYDEVLRVPLIIRYPDRIRPGSRYADQARMIDVAPTLMDLAGFPAPTDMMGRALTPLFEGGALDGEAPAVAELLVKQAELFATRLPRRKIIYNKRTGGALVFDLARDPDEQHASAGESDPLVELARADLFHASLWLNRAKQKLAEIKQSSIGLSAPLRAQLESLGYIGGYDDLDPNEAERGVRAQLAPELPAGAPPGHEADDEGASP